MYCSYLINSVKGAGKKKKKKKKERGKNIEIQKCRRDPNGHHSDLPITVGLTAGPSPHSHT